VSDEIPMELKERLRADLNGSLLNGSPSAGFTQATYELLSVADLAGLPEPAWLVEKLLPARGFSVLYGPSGAGKTFLAADWALCIAESLAWYGRGVTGAWVLYIAAEGSNGLHRRVTAWQTARRRQTVEQIRFLPEAVNLLDHVELVEWTRSFGHSWACAASRSACCC
jgi:AAA domain